MMQSADIHVTDVANPFQQRVHRGDVARENDAVSRILDVRRVLLNSGRDVSKTELHLGRNSHAVEILLPVATRDFIVDHTDEPYVERLSPTDNDLAMNHPIIDSVELYGHQPFHCTSRAPRPFSAAWRAASPGSSSVLKTNSSNVARFAPVTRMTPGVSRMIRRTAIVALPAGRSVKKTLMPSSAARSRIRASMSSPLKSEFESGMKTLPKPVICSTALTIPCGKDP